MNDQTIPAGLTRDEAKAVREWAERARAAKVQDETVAHAARVLLAVLPKRPTLADMPDEDRRECHWMQADVDGFHEKLVIVTPCDDDVALISADGGIEWMDHDAVTPRPDLRPLAWPSEKKVEDVAPVKVGDVIESADDPRVTALPVGTVLRDIDGEEVTKMDGSIDPWSGPGYVPIAGDGTEFGPWTVARLPRKPATAPAPALPDGWRLADHQKYGRVIVTAPTPNSDGRVYYVLPSADPMGIDWLSCRPDELTFLDTGQEADQ